MRENGWRDWKKLIVAWYSCEAIYLSSSCGVGSVTWQAGGGGWVFFSPVLVGHSVRVAVCHVAGAGRVETGASSDISNA